MCWIFTGASLHSLHLGSCLMRGFNSMWNTSGDAASPGCMLHSIVRWWTHFFVRQSNAIFNDTDKNLSDIIVFSWLLILYIVINPLLYLLATLVGMFEASRSHLGSQVFGWGKKGRYETALSEPHYDYYCYVVRAFWVIPLMCPWNERSLGAGDYASVTWIFPRDFHLWLELTWLKFSPPRS